MTTTRQRRDRQGALKRFRLTIAKRLKRQRRAEKREAWQERERKNPTRKRKPLIPLAERQKRNREKRERYAPKAKVTP